MSPEKQREIIAEACGWEFIRVADPDPDDLWSYWKNTKSGATSLALPDYLHDLNAIQAAVLAQPPDLESAFGDYFQKKSEAKYRDEKFPFQVLEWRMTAADWCECLLKALGKWEDKKNEQP